MAKPNPQTGKKTEEAEGNGSAIVKAGPDELAQMLEGVELATDGLDEVSGEDIKLPVQVFNFKGVDRAGDPIAPNVFYDTIAETTSKEKRVVLLVLHKSNEWREYDEAKGESQIKCKSFDRVTGTMEDGRQRPCNGCPDAQWTSDPVTKKRTRRCGPVHNVVGVDRATGEPSLFRFKKTSLSPWQIFLNKFFIGRMILGGGKRGNVPLFAYETVLRLVMSDDKKYAIPTFERGARLERDEILAAADTAKTYQETLLPALDKLAAQDKDSGGSGNAPDTSFSPEQFADDANAAGAPPPPPPAANRF